MATTFNKVCLFQKVSGTDATNVGKVYNSYTDFGFALGQDFDMPDSEVVDLVSRQWPGEDGEDTYWPETSAQKAADLSMKLIYKGNSDALAAYKKLFDYLRGADGSGTRLNIYDVYHGGGYADCWLKSFSNYNHGVDNAGQALELTAKFRVTNPSKTIILSE